jgi:hypothetical protein
LVALDKTRHRLFHFLACLQQEWNSQGKRFFDLSEHGLLLT